MGGFGQSANEVAIPKAAVAECQVRVESASSRNFRSRPESGIQLCMLTETADVERPPSPSLSAERVHRLRKLFPTSDEARNVFENQGSQTASGTDFGDRRPNS